MLFRYFAPTFNVQRPSHRCRHACASSILGMSAGPLPWLIMAHWVTALQRTQPTAKGRLLEAIWG